GARSVLLGKGDGTFGSPARANVNTAGATWVVTGDFNSDGRADFAVLGQSPVDLAGYLGDGTGSFSAPWNYAITPSNSGRLLVADVSGDGKTDLVIVGAMGSDSSVLLGNGDGTFQDARVYHFSNPAGAEAAADLNRDGNTDLILFEGFSTPAFD